MQAVLSVGVCGELVEISSLGWHFYIEPTHPSVAWSGAMERQTAGIVARASGVIL